MARQLPKTRPISRRPPHRAVKLELLVVCEGKNTEPEYLENFSRDHSNGLVRLILIREGGVPRTIVERAIVEKRHLTRLARRSQDSFDAQFEVWGVCDTDNHPNIHEAKTLARDHGISLAISNPCIELWALLHIRQHQAEISSRTLQRTLHTLMPTYDHRRGARFDYGFMRDSYSDARCRAIEQIRSREQENCPGCNPSTDIYLLLDTIISNGKS